MAKTSFWIADIESFVDVATPSYEQTASRDAIASLLKKDLLTIEDLIKEMGLYLTTTDHVIRGRGILLLAELLTCLAQKPLENTTVHSLVAFFTEKLADWQVLHGTLMGCLALLRRKSNVGVVTGSDARSLVRTYAQTVQVQSLGRHDRKLCFEIIDCLLNHHPDVVATLGDDLVSGICEAIDGEKDPQCIMLTFHIVADLAKLFPDPFGVLAGFSEDLFDVLGRYFPVHFTHPNDGLDVKRDDLSRALMLAFSSTPLFEPFVIPLLLEKLSSSLPLAKADSLKYLTHCSVKYGADLMAKHAKVIWSSLKDNIFDSLEEGILAKVAESLADTDISNNEIAKEALLCVQKFMLQEDGLFLSLILEDDDLELILMSATTVETYNDSSIESRQKLYALGCILSASAVVSMTCCNRIFQHFFPRLMDVLGLSTKYSNQACITDAIVAIPEKRNFGALYLCIELLVACRDLALSSEEHPSHFFSVEETWCYMIKNSFGPLTEVFRLMLITDTPQDVLEVDIQCGVKGLLILATYPRHFLPISESTFGNILNIFISILISGCGGTPLWKLTLKALMGIGSSIDRFHDSEKEIIFMTIVVDKLVSLICHDHSTLPLPFQLEAISSIGTRGINFMLRVTQGLEAAITAKFSEAPVKGNLKSAETLIYLLECYSNKVLPWYDRRGGFEDVALRFTLTIWDQIEYNDTSIINIQGKELLDKMMTTMKLAVAGCSETSQALIVQKAYSVLSSSTSSLLKSLLLVSAPENLEELQLTQGFTNLSSRDEWIIYLFVSVIIALRPQTPVQNVREIMNLFTGVLLKGHVLVAQGLGSVINKLPSTKSAMDVSNACTLEEAMDIALSMGSRGNSLGKCSTKKGNGEDYFTSLKVGDCDLVQSNAIYGLAWIGKGLVMRGNERVKDVIKMILGCLLSHSELRTSPLQQGVLENHSQENTHPLVMRSAADAFHILLSDSVVCLNNRFHAMVKPLYKQRFFSSMMPILLTSIKESNSSTTRSMLYRAFGNLISNTPLAAVVNEAKALIFVLLDCISILSENVHDRNLMYSLLLVLSGMIMDTNGREAVTENAHIIINRLTGLVSYPHMMLVRETAIQCLVAMSALPHTRIFPIRTQVLRALSRAVDDPKRTVRREAVRCRQAWASIASRSVYF